ncbi:unnamed protein product, partial [marine sediment metagenome]
KKTSTLEDHLSCKKTLLLYDWIKGNKEMKSLEQEYLLYKGEVLRLAEGFGWLADSLAAIAESGCWKKKRKEDLKQIILLSERLIEGIEEKGLSLARMYIPGLSRDYIGRLVGAGYGDEECLKGVSEEELGKIVPKGLAERIKKIIPSLTVLSSSSTKNYKPNTHNPKLVARNLPPNALPSPSKTENRELKTVLQIDKHRPDRIIFMGEKIEVTATEFSLIHLLAQNRGKILTHNDLLGTIWKGSEDATYVQITYHLYKIRRDILKIIGNNKKNKERVKDIFKVISRRGIM